MENKKRKITNSGLVIIFAALVAVPFFSNSTFDRFFSFIRGQGQTQTVVTGGDRCDDAFGNGGGPVPNYQNYDSCKIAMSSARSACYQCCSDTHGPDDVPGGQQCADNCSAQYQWFMKWECCRQFPTASECTSSSKVEVIRN